MQLTAENYEQDARAQIYNSQVSKTEVLPWLEMTRWPRYFHGLNMTEVALLAFAANLMTEPALVLLGESFNQLNEHRHQSICEDKISVFNQAQINSFITGRSGKHNVCSWLN
jgi:ABC-type molybdenum transport system ATPase subunit/photorepair protein PhrA